MPAREAAVKKAAPPASIATRNAVALMMQMMSRSLLQPSGDARVPLSDGRTVAMRDLAVGDKVKSFLPQTTFTAHRRGAEAWKALVHRCRPLNVMQTVKDASR